MYSYLSVPFIIICVLVTLVKLVLKKFDLQFLFPIHNVSFIRLQQRMDFFSRINDEMRTQKTLCIISIIYYFMSKVHFIG